ncbi:alkylhydroperoxidase domain protein [Microbacterium sp. NC79]|uniref:alkylhydroperoxidase domain protein n=1 Tax=Microbacterium sp. NC79 TaxID=2851009 RepID=UPI001C2C380F|nr:alkylhydroperoxidase domain protein [Microbacterium sp. NC79]MBV0894484.1 alkylhydroperoxidase domain protein [Microbacterium sp. NC79]
MTATTVEVLHHKVHHPHAFTRGEVGWLPWLEPVAIDALTPRHYEGLVDRARDQSDYFRLLARDPEILRARTLVDKDIFYNAKDGLPRAERELAAAAASRINGCVFCASVHARFAAHFLKETAPVDALLADGQLADLGPRLNALVEASAALTTVPTVFGATEVRALRAAGFTTDEIVDIVHSTAFFNWANRLMLSIGRPVAPAGE